MNTCATIQRSPADLQNQHVLRCLSHAQRAAALLNTQGISIEQVSLGGARPVIRVRYSRRCEQLGEAILRIHGNNGQRYAENHVEFERCTVIWRDGRYQ
ncbi:hypothetical protein GCM10023116_30950 [Kistimonas scapharcae]|uniref:Uncharacterized protein n=1 Tax=Kistimonas scapharcae TaxID=1036133 RepID=A0ABP8V4T6_9GAMM